MIGLSVHPVQVQDTRVLHAVSIATALLGGCLSATVDYEPQMRKKKQSFELTFEQTEMLGRFGDASSDYPRLSFEEVARKLLGPKPFKATTKGKKFEKVCREVFDRERE